MMNGDHDHGEDDDTLSSVSTLSHLFNVTTRAPGELALRNRNGGQWCVFRVWCKGIFDALDEHMKSGCHLYSQLGLARLFLLKIGAWGDFSFRNPNSRNFKKVTIGRVTKMDFQHAQLLLRITEVPCADTMGLTNTNPKIIVETNSDLAHILHQNVKPGDYLVMWGGKETVVSSSGKEVKLLQLNDAHSTQASVLIHYRQDGVFSFPMDRDDNRTMSRNNASEVFYEGGVDNDVVYVQQITPKAAAQSGWKVIGSSAPCTSPVQSPAKPRRSSPEQRARRIETVQSEPDSPSQNMKMRSSKSRSPRKNNENIATRPSRQRPLRMSVPTTTVSSFSSAEKQPFVDLDGDTTDDVEANNEDDLISINSDAIEVIDLGDSEERNSDPVPQSNTPEREARQMQLSPTATTVSEYSAQASSASDRYRKAPSEMSESVFGVMDEMLYNLSQSTDEGDSRTVGSTPTKDPDSSSSSTILYETPPEQSPVSDSHRPLQESESASPFFSAQGQGSAKTTRQPSTIILKTISISDDPIYSEMRQMFEDDGDYDEAPNYFDFAANSYSTTSNAAHSKTGRTCSSSTRSVSAEPVASPISVYFDALSNQEASGSAHNTAPMAATKKSKCASTLSKKNSTDKATSDDLHESSQIQTSQLLATQDIVSLSQAEEMMNAARSQRSSQKSNTLQTSQLLGTQDIGSLTQIENGLNPEPRKSPGPRSSRKSNSPQTSQLLRTSDILSLSQAEDLMHAERSTATGSSDSSNTPPTSQLLRAEDFQSLTQIELNAEGNAGSSEKSNSTTQPSSQLLGSQNVGSFSQAEENLLMAERLTETSVHGDEDAAAEADSESPSDDEATGSNDTSYSDFTEKGLVQFFDLDPVEKILFKVRCTIVSTKLVRKSAKEFYLRVRDGTMPPFATKRFIQTDPKSPVSTQGSVECNNPLLAAQIDIIVRQASELYVIAETNIGKRVTLHNVALEFDRKDKIHYFSMNGNLPFTTIVAGTGPGKHPPTRNEEDTRQKQKESPQIHGSQNSNPKDISTKLPVKRALFPPSRHQRIARNAAIGSGVRDRDRNESSGSGDGNSKTKKTTASPKTSAVKKRARIISSSEEEEEEETPTNKKISEKEKPLSSKSKNVDGKKRKRRTDSDEEDNHQKVSKLPRLPRVTVDLPKITAEELQRSAPNLLSPQEKEVSRSIEKRKTRRREVVEESSSSGSSSIEILEEIPATPRKAASTSPWKARVSPVKARSTRTKNSPTKKSTNTPPQSATKKSRKKQIVSSPGQSSSSSPSPGPSTPRRSARSSPKVGPRKVDSPQGNRKRKAVYGMRKRR